jgi:hypothetical protein
MSALRQGIRDGYAQGLPVRVIAERCGTSEAVVRVTAMRMGLKHPIGRGRPKKALA